MGVIEKSGVENRIATLVSRFQLIRSHTHQLCEPLEVEDFLPQPIPDVSPPKWHLGHTTWFFETFILRRFSAGYECFQEEFHWVFNSYYQTVNQPWTRAERGHLSRPTVAEVFKYRAHVDAAIIDLINGLSESQLDEVEQLIEIGVQHEQQHQELLATDIKYIFAINPLRPIYLPMAETQNSRHAEARADSCEALPENKWISFAEGTFRIGFGADGETGFHFDNEGPVHRVFLEPYALQQRLVTNGDYLKFIEAGGYQQFQFWLDDGWTTVKQQNWDKPLFWHKADGEWFEITLHGWRKLDLNAPVTHVSFYEADAYARWRGFRLPTEQEWEAAVRKQGFTESGANLQDFKRLHPKTLESEAAVNNASLLLQTCGDCWEWTRSSYEPYPGYKPLEGALGEYNGKFMSNQMVLRGGSCVTPAQHVRISYRNFFYPDKRWQFTGIRLAKSLH